MKKAEFPERSCREHVNYSVGDGPDAIPMVALCELPEHIDQETGGPCVNFGVASSVARREAWEKEQTEGE